MPDPPTFQIATPRSGVLSSLKFRKKTVVQNEHVDRPGKSQSTTASRLRYLLGGLCHLGRRERTSAFHLPFGQLSVVRQCRETPRRRNSSEDQLDESIRGPVSPHVI